MDLRSILLPLFVLWGFGSLLILFRKSIEPVWRISALLVSVFYLIWFREDLNASFLSYTTALNHTIVALLHFLHQFLGLSLLLFWPPALFIAFIAGSRGLSSGLMRFLVLVTLFYWIFSLAVQVTGLDLVKPLERWLPEKLTLPTTEGMKSSLKKIEGMKGSAGKMEGVKGSLEKMDAISKALKKMELPKMPSLPDAKKAKAR